MTVQVCVGSSCHLKGSYDIVQLMKKALAENGLEDTVQLGGAFCLGRCTEGVTIKVNDELVTGVSTENFDEIFKKHILQK